MPAENKKGNDSASILLVSLVAIVAIVGVVIMLKGPMTTSDDVVGEAGSLQNDPYSSYSYDSYSSSYDPYSSTVSYKCPNPSLKVDPTPTVSWNIVGGPGGSIDLAYTTITVNVNSKGTCPELNMLTNRAVIMVVGKADITWDEMRAGKQTTTKEIINVIVPIKKNQDVIVCDERQNEMTAAFTGIDIEKAVKDNILEENKVIRSPKKNLEIRGIKEIKIEYILTESQLVRTDGGKCAGLSIYRLHNPLEGLKEGETSIVNDKPLRQGAVIGADYRKLI